MSSQPSSHSRLVEAIVDQLRRQSTQTVLFHQMIADRLGLNITDHKCLNFLLEQGPLTAGKLAELTGLTTGAVTGIIDRLEQAGFARRVRDAKDRRRVIIEHIPEQLGRIEALFASVGQSVGQVCQTYGEQELALIVSFLRELHTSFQDECAKLQNETKARESK